MTFLDDRGKIHSEFKFALDDWHLYGLRLRLYKVLLQLINRNLKYNPFLNKRTPAFYFYASQSTQWTQDINLDIIYTSMVNNIHLCIKVDENRMHVVQFLLGVGRDPLWKCVDRKNTIHLFFTYFFSVEHDIISF